MPHHRSTTRRTSVRPGPGSRWLAFSACVCLLIAGCAARPSSPATVRSWLDERSGATFVALDQPLVFYRAEPLLSAHGRDYLLLGPVSVSRSLDRATYMWLGVYSTIDRQLLTDRTPAAADLGDLWLFVDGEPMELRSAGTSALPEARQGLPYLLPVATGRERYYAVTSDQIRRLAIARTVSIVADADPAAAPTYELWHGELASVRDFSAALPRP